MPTRRKGLKQKVRSKRVEARAKSKKAERELEGSSPLLLVSFLLFSYMFCLFYV